MTHGGKRPGAGRPRTPIDEKRVQALISSGLSLSEVAARFNVSHHVIRRIVIRLQSIDATNAK